jgi:hypothetical protein
MKSLITPQMHAVLGGVVDSRTSFPLSASDIRRWAIAIYWPDRPPRDFLSADGEMIAPVEFNPFAWGAAKSRDPATQLPRRDPDKLEKALGIAGPGLCNQIAAGVEAEYGADMRPGDVITAVTRLAEYSERRGRLGQMLLTVTETLWTNQRGEQVRRERTTSIRY